MIVEWVEDENGNALINIYDGDMVDDNYGVITYSPVDPDPESELSPHYADLTYLFQERRKKSII